MIDYTARVASEPGADVVKVDRNVWQPGHDESLRFVDQLREILAEYPSI